MYRNLLAKATLVTLASLLFIVSITQAATVLFPSGGGTGTSTPPAYGQIPVGNGNGTYSLLATSSLGITGGGTSAATTTIIAQTSHGFTAGKWVGLSGNQYALTNAVAGGVYQNVGLVASVTDANHFVLQTGGDFTDTNLIPGMSYYLSASTTALGTIVGYPPTTVGQISAPVAIAKTQAAASMNIGRPSIVAQSTASFGMNVGNDQIGSTYYATSSNISDAAMVSKNLANKQVRIALPSYNNPIGIYNMRELAKYYKSLGFAVSYGVTGLSGVQNTTTYNNWKAQVIATELPWACSNGINRFYIGNEEDWQAQIGNFGGGVTGDGVRSDVRGLSTTARTYANVNGCSSMEIVYSTAEGTVAQWGAFNGDFGSLDKVGFNMYNTLAGFDAGVAYFQSQIGSKFFVTEWAANHPYYDMVNGGGETDATYAADLASRQQTLNSRGVEAYFFSLRYGNNTLGSGNWNILLNTGVFNPGAFAAFGGGGGNAVKNTPLVLIDDQKFYLNNAKTAYMTANSTYFSITGPAFGAILFSGPVSMANNLQVTGGNIGIGGTAPNYRLLITDNTGSHQFNITNDLDSDFQIKVTQSGATDKYALLGPATNTGLAFGTGGTESMRLKNGKLSIGTTTALATLDVVATGSHVAGSGGTLEISDGASRSFMFRQDSTTLDLNIDSQAAGIWSTPLTLTRTGGLLGISTSSPFAKLSVSGSAGGTVNLVAISTSTSLFATTTALRVSQSGNLHFMNGAGIDIGVGVNPGGNNIVVQGTASTTNLTVSGLPNCNTTGALTTTSSGAVACGSVSGGAAFPFTATSHFGVNTSATSTVLNATAGIFASSTSQFVNANFYGNVGLGTSSPFISGLTIVGGTFFSPEVALSTSTSMSLGVASSSQQLIRYSTSATTINISNYQLVPGMKTTLTTCNQLAGTAGAITFTNLHFAGGVQPGNTTTANQCDMWFITVIAGTSTPIAVLTGMTPGIQ